MLSSGTWVWALQTVDCSASYLALPEVRYNARSWSLNLKWCLLLLIQAPSKSQSTATKRPPAPGRMPRALATMRKGWWWLGLPSAGSCHHQVLDGSVARWNPEASHFPWWAGDQQQQWNAGAEEPSPGQHEAVVWCFHQLLQIKEEDKIRTDFVRLADVCNDPPHNFCQPWFSSSCFPGICGVDNQCLTKDFYTGTLWRGWQSSNHSRLQQCFKICSDSRRQPFLRKWQDGRLMALGRQGGHILAGFISLTMMTTLTTMMEVKKIKTWRKSQN